MNKSRIDRIGLRLPKGVADRVTRMRLLDVETGP